MAKRVGGITAAELMDQLNSDPEYREPERYVHQSRILLNL